MIIPKQQITAEPGDVTKIRNTVTCEETVQFTWTGTRKALGSHLAEVMLQIPYEWSAHRTETGYLLVTVKPRSL